MSTPRPSTPDGQGVLGMVLKGYPRLSETFISNEIRLLEEEGFRIAIISMRPPRESIQHASVASIKAKVVYLPEYLLPGLPAFLRTNLAWFVRHPLRYMKGVALLLRRFPDAPKKHTWLKHFLQAGYLLHETRNDPPITHFHAHFAHTPSSVALYAAVLSGTDFSFTAHAKDIYTQKPGPVRLKLALARFCVTCTRYNQRYLRSLLPPGSDMDVHCVYHGIDLSLFSPADRSMEAAPPYSLLTVARFVEKKGLFRILDALALLDQQGVDFTWTLIGSGDLHDKLLARIEELGLGERVQFTGAIPHEEVLEHYRKAHCFVLGCKVAADGDRDGIPNVLAEAMAMGVPAVATDVSGIPELLEHERTGLIVPDAALQEGAAPLAAALARVLTDTELRERTIPAALERVQKIFDNKRLIRDLAQIYKEHGLGPQE